LVIHKLYRLKANVFSLLISKLSHPHSFHLDRKCASDLNIFGSYRDA